MKRTSRAPEQKTTESLSVSAAIRHEVDIFWGRQKVVEMARQLGFSQSAQWEISIVVSEMGSNIIKFAPSGIIRFEPTLVPPGIRIEATDTGPGIEDIEAAMEDGFSEGQRIGEEWRSERRGLGAGLGAMGRLMDSIKVENMDKGGLRIVVFKYLL